MVALNPAWPVRGKVLDDLVRSAKLPNANLPDLIELSRQFLVEHPESRFRPEAERLLDDFVKTLDDRDIDKARDFSKRSPTEFAKRIDRYGEYLKAHAKGGRYISEATEAKDRILRAWDTGTTVEPMTTSSPTPTTWARLPASFATTSPSTRKGSGSPRPSATSNGGTRSPWPTTTRSRSAEARSTPSSVPPSAEPQTSA